ncbi:MAG: hypothetical protein IJE81_00865 [Oscillospiraceae bacterium]|nr:hypothetical protein [Oscillospiraceae bacterium]
MKKSYSKPEIAYESFALSTNIAGNCFFIINNSVKYVCAFYDERENKNVFTTDIGACTTKNEDGANGVCYHVPVDTSDLFNS